MVYVLVPVAVSDSLFRVDSFYMRAAKELVSLSINFVEDKCDTQKMKISYLHHLFKA